MEPRWYSGWRCEAKFLGGTPEYDLWIDQSKDIRVVQGNSHDQWDWFHWNHHCGEFLWGSRDSDTMDHDEILEGAVLYVSLFAPWALEETKTGHNRYHREGSNLERLRATGE